MPRQSQASANEKLQQCSCQHWQLPLLFTKFWTITFYENKLDFCQKMKLLNILCHSVVVKHVLFLFLLITTVLGVGFFVLYHSVRDLLLKNVQEKAYLICRENVTQYDQTFSTYESVTRFFSDILADTPVDRWDAVLKITLEKIEHTNPEICAIGAATIPDAKKNDTGTLSLALYEKQGVEIRHETSYTNKSWYSDTIKKKSGNWSEPFHGQVIHDLISVYSCPIFRTMPDGSKQMIGVACLDLKIDWLDRDISNLMLDNQGEVVLFSRQRRFLTSKFKENIGKKYDEVLSL